MRSFLFCALVFLAMPHAAWADRLIDGVHVIYREATGDYEFRVQFAYEPDLWSMTQRPPPATVAYPDTVFAFVILDSSGRTPGAVTSIDVPATDQMALYDWRSVEASREAIGYFDFSLDANDFSVIVPDVAIDHLGVPDLFAYRFVAERINVGSYQLGYHPESPRLVSLNVPEPTTMDLVAGTLLFASLLTRRRSRHRRQPGP